MAPGGSQAGGGPLGARARPEPGPQEWYGHDPARWEAFRARYLDELRGHAAELDALRALARTRPLTLVFAARDPDRSSAAVLREVLLG